MTPDDVVFIVKQTLEVGLQLTLPLLGVAMVVGVLISLIQSVTQIQEQTVAFVPKIVAMVLALSITLPWLISRMVQYSTDLIEGIPARF